MENEIIVSGVATPEYFEDQIKRNNLWFEYDLVELEIQPDVIGLVSAKCADDLHIVPVEMQDGVLVVVTDSERVFKHVEFLEQAVNLHVKVLLTANENLKRGLVHYYSVANNSFRSGGNSNTDQLDEDSSALKKNVSGMVIDAIKQNVSDIHILPHMHGAFVHFRVNGHLVDVSHEYGFTRSSEESKLVVNIVKGMCNPPMESTNVKMPDKGSFYISLGGGMVDVRVSTLPLGMRGQKLNLRILQANKKKLKLGDLGYLPEDLKQIRRALWKSPTGLFLITGPTGAGKTTSLYAQIYDVLDRLGEPTNIITIEDPVEYSEMMFCQVQVTAAEDESKSLTAAKIFKTSLRQDPNLLLYGEIRDGMDAITAIQAATTGHQVFSTVHARGCVPALNRLFDLNVPKGSLLNELNFIISQRLVGRLCPECSQPYDLTEDDRSILSKKEISFLNAGNMRRRARLEEYTTCPGHCNYGYVGRVAVAEYVVFDMALRDILLQETRLANIAQALKARGFRSMWEKGLDLVRDGQTDLMEVIRTIGVSEVIDDV